MLKMDRGKYIRDHDGYSNLMKSLKSFEADDIMATLVKKAEETGLITYLVTSDKDMMQLISESTFMYSPGNSFKPTSIYDK